MLDHAEIASCLPHSGRMCLLERVLRWDERSIRCSAISHCDPDNPLRNATGLATLSGIEYAAQAAAVHGSLLHPAQTPRSGVMAALKNVTVCRPWLHDVPGEIVIDTNLLHSDSAGGIFTFSIVARNERLLSGQFTLMYTDERRKPPA